jgi:two-component system, chemotaxis family, CheB/CheR fusion protein
MPGENGYEFARWVRARAGNYIPAIAITGFASTQDREEAARAGFDDHLAKPVNADELIAKLLHLLRRSGPRLPRSGEIARTVRRSGLA